MSFPNIPNPRSYGWVAGVQQGSNADTIIEQPCLKPDKFEGELADCGCPMRAAAPEPPAMPFPTTEEKKGRRKQFLVDTYRESTFNTCQHQPLPMMHGPPLEFFKPLLRVMNNRSRESTDNPRLVRLKEKTLGWRFKIIHIP